MLLIRSLVSLTVLCWRSDNRDPIRYLTSCQGAMLEDPPSRPRSFNTISTPDFCPASHRHRTCIDCLFACSYPAVEPSGDSTFDESLSSATALQSDLYKPSFPGAQNFREQL